MHQSRNLDISPRWLQIVCLCTHRFRNHLSSSRVPNILLPHQLMIHSPSPIFPVQGQCPHWLLFSSRDFQQTVMTLKHLPKISFGLHASFSVSSAVVTARTVLAPNLRPKCLVTLVHLPESAISIFPTLARLTSQSFLIDLHIFLWRFLLLQWGHQFAWAKALLSRGTRGICIVPPRTAQTYRGRASQYGTVSCEFKYQTLHCWKYL